MPSYLKHWSHNFPRSQVKPLIRTLASKIASGIQTKSWNTIIVSVYANYEWDFQNSASNSDKRYTAQCLRTTTIQGVSDADINTIFTHHSHVFERLPPEKCCPWLQEKMLQSTERKSICVVKRCGVGFTVETVNGPISQKFLVISTMFSTSSTSRLKPKAYWEQLWNDQITSSSIYK